MRRFGVKVSDVARAGDRIGICYLESGANQRPANVVYDRSRSAMADADPAEFEWDKIVERGGRFHVTGITAAISQAGADLTQAAVKAGPSH